MSNSVCECICTRQPRFPLTEFKLCVLPQASGSLGHVLSGQDMFVVVLLVLALVAAVVLTALWGKPARRRDALALLDRIIPWRW